MLDKVFARKAKIPSIPKQASINVTKEAYESIRPHAATYTGGCRDGLLITAYSATSKAKIDF
jgi:hypothetical protein